MKDHRLATVCEECEGRRFTRTLTDDQRALRRPGRFWFNAVLTLVVLVVLIAGWLPPSLEPHTFDPYAPHVPVVALHGRDDRILSASRSCAYACANA